MPEWLDSDRALADFAGAIPAGQPVALDTEFDWTRTYYPVLALLQIGIDRERVGVVDALAVRDWRPLRDLLADGGHRIVVFSGGHDLPLMVRACGGPEACLPKNVFDVQVAGVFCGGKSVSPALKAVVLEQLGIELDKHETRSDWTKRPLTDSQLAYAAGDVALLPELAARFDAMLAENGNADAFADEMSLWERPEAYAEPPAELAWRRLKNFNSFNNNDARTRARVLAVWREKSARQRNLPRGWILSDEQITWLANYNPQSANQMSAMPQGPHGAGRHQRDEMLAAMRDATPAPEDKGAPPIRASYLRARMNVMRERLFGLVASRAKARHVPEEFLASHRELEAVAYNRLTGLPYRESRIFTGWRADLLQPVLDEILHSGGVPAAGHSGT